MTIITSHHYDALPYLLAKSIRKTSPEDVTKLVTIVEEAFGPSGEAEYEDLTSLEAGDFRALCKDNKLTLPLSRFKEIGPALKLVGVKTPICPECRELALVKEDGEWRTIRSGQCPQETCKGLIERLQVATHHTSWVDAQQVAIDITVSRDFGPTPVPLTNHGIEEYLQYEFGVGMDARLSIKHSRAANILFCHSEFSSRFSTPFGVLGALANPLSAQLTRTDLQRVEQIARNPSWYKRDGGQVEGIAAKAAELEIDFSKDPSFVREVVGKVYYAGGSGDNHAKLATALGVFQEWRSRPYEDRENYLCKAVVGREKWLFKWAASLDPSGWKNPFGQVLETRQKRALQELLVRFIRNPSELRDILERVNAHTGNIGWEGYGVTASSVCHQVAYDANVLWEKHNQFFDLLEDKYPAHRNEIAHVRALFNLEIPK